MAVGLAGLAAFQAALAIGTPWGRASYGGAHIGVLPSRLRVVSAGAALLYSGLSVAIVSRRTPLRVRRHVLTGITALMGGCRPERHLAFLARASDVDSHNRPAGSTGLASSPGRLRRSSERQIR